MIKRNTTKHLTNKTDLNRSKQQVLNGESKKNIKDDHSRVNDNRNPFLIPQHMRLFSKNTKKKRDKTKTIIMDEPKTVCDIDETFFKTIDGRPIRQFSDIKVYMTNIRDNTLCRANASYLKDRMIQIDTVKSDEIEEYDKIEKLYCSIKSSFVHFAKQSFESAKQCELLCKERENLLDIAIDKLNGYSFTYNKIRNEVDYFEAVFEILSKYGEFLFNISPITWKKQQGNIFAKKESGFLRAFSSDIYTPSTQSKNRYDNIITTLKSNEPILYFRKPAELIHVFEELSKQCSNYMEMDIITSSMKRNVFRRGDYLRAIIEHEADEVRDIINMYNIQITFLELKESEYKSKFYRVLLNEFHNLYASYEPTKLFTCLQYVHTQVFSAQEDQKDSIVTLAHNLESHYIEIMSQFDYLDQEVVKNATNELFAADRKLMKQALFAQRTLKECDILKKCLYSSFKPPTRQRNLRL